MVGCRNLTMKIGGREMKIITKVMRQTTWQRILNDIKAGGAAKYAGIETEITLKDGTTAVLVVVAVNHYKSNEVVFAFRDYLSDRKPMNKDRDNADGGWKKSDLRKWLNKKFIKLLPDDLQEVISKKKTVQVIDGECYKCKDYLFLPSEMEMFGECKYSEEQEGEKQFPYYADKHNRSRTVGKNGYWDYGWLSSPYTTEFCIVSSVGNTGYGDACGSVGVAPVFVIR